MEPEQKKGLEFSKIIVGFLLLNGIAWVWCSYYLAYKGFVEIAEALSKTVVTEILGVMLVYCLKAGVENLAKNNDWPDKQKCKESESDSYGPP